MLDDEFSSIEVGALGVDRVVVEPQDVADLRESFRRLYLTFHINLLICCHELDSDIGPGPFDLETR
jgi:hypothetical protein